MFVLSLQSEQSSLERVYELIYLSAQEEGMRERENWFYHQVQHWRDLSCYCANTLPLIIYWLFMIANLVVNVFTILNTQRLWGLEYEATIPVCGCGCVCVSLFVRTCVLDNTYKEGRMVQYLCSIPNTHSLVENLVPLYPKQPVLVVLRIQYMYRSCFGLQDNSHAT